MFDLSEHFVLCQLSPTDIPGFASFIFNSANWNATIPSPSKKDKYKLSQDAPIVTLIFITSLYV